MLKGSLEEFAPQHIFKLIAGVRKTGRLELIRQAGRGSVYFREGEIYFAESSLTREPLGQKLIRAGVISESELMKALDEHAATGTRVGEVLVRNNAIDKDQLGIAIRAQVKDAAFDLLKWDIGEFEFEPSEEVVAEIPIRLSVMELLSDAAAAPPTAHYDIPDVIDASPEPVVQPEPEPEPEPVVYVAPEPVVER